jgi:hypothetical protein
MSNLGYQLHVNEPSAFIEIYLPKKAELQGILFKTLTDAFQLEKVKEHFLQADQAKQGKIRQMLQEGFPAPGQEADFTIFPATYSREEIENFPRIFFGYSLYEVDGVYLKQRKNRPQADEDFHYEEERSQVIRMIFKYDCAGESPRSIGFYKAALRDPMAEVLPLRENTFLHQDLLPDDWEQKARNLNRWVRAVGIFVFGYVLFNISQAILEKQTEDHPQREQADLKQDEIWVTSFWNMNINTLAGKDGATTK